MRGKSPPYERREGKTPSIERALDRHTSLVSMHRSSETDVSEKQATCLNEDIKRGEKEKRRKAYKPYSPSRKQSSLRKRKWEEPPSTDSSVTRSCSSTFDTFVTL